MIINYFGLFVPKQANHNKRSVVLYTTSLVEGREKKPCNEETAKQPTQNARSYHTSSCITFENFSRFQLQDEA